MKRNLDPTSGARRELRLALSRVRAAITHLAATEHRNYVPPKLRSLVTRTRRDLYAVESDLCRQLSALACDNSRMPTLGKAS